MSNVASAGGVQEIAVGRVHHGSLDVWETELNILNIVDANND